MALDDRVVSDVSYRVSGKLYECSAGTADDSDIRRFRLGCEAITIALLAVLEELREQGRAGER